MYNLESIFSEGYVDSAALRLFLESLIEDQKELANLKDNFEKENIKTTVITSSYDFVSKNNLDFESANFRSSTITVNNKDVYCYTVIELGDYVKNIRQVECFYNVFEMENNNLKSEVMSGKINNAYIRTDDSQGNILIQRNCIEKLRLSSKHVVFLHLKYKTTSLKENVEVTKNEDYSTFENLLFTSDL